MRKKFKPSRTESIEIHWTDDYDVFEFLPINRKVKQTHVEELIESIKEKGFIKDYPIIVVQHDNRFFIVSGQHRFLASKQLKTEFAFRLTDKTQQDEMVIQEHFGLLKDWAIDDVLKYWANKNDDKHKNYQDFAEYVSSFNFPTSVSLQFVVGLDMNTGRPLQKDYLRDFKLGKFKVSKNRLKVAEQAGDQVRQALAIKNLGRYSKNASVLKSLYMLINHDNFSPNRLLHAFRTTPKPLIITGRKFDETLEQIVDYYNGTMKRKKVAFDDIFKRLEKQRKRARRIV